MKRVITFSWFNGQPDLPLEEDKISTNGCIDLGWNELIQFLALHIGIECQPIKKNKRILSYMHALEKTGENLIFKELFQKKSCGHCRIPSKAA